MADFRIWGRIEHIGAREFFVVASAVPEVGAERPIVLTITAGSLQEANAEKSKLVTRVGEAVRARGDRVVDVEECS